jgi:hypothetical protein
MWLHEALGIAPEGQPQRRRMATYEELLH